jgi:hypothetical protein
MQINHPDSRRKLIAGAVAPAACCRTVPDVRLRHLAARVHTIFFKIEYFDRDLKYHSPDPTDPAVTMRVITVMLAEEY